MTKTVLLVFISGTIASSAAQSGDGLLEDEIGLTVLSFAAFIILILAIVWMWFCCRLFIVNKESKDEIKRNDRARDKWVAANRRQQAIQMDRRNMRRAIDNSLADVNRNRDTPDTESLEVFVNNRRMSDDEAFFDMALRKNTTPTPPRPTYETQEDLPPSFDSVIPFGQQNPSYTPSTHPPYKQQQRMLSTFQNIPKMTPDDSNNTNRQELTDRATTNDTEYVNEELFNSEDRFGLLQETSLDEDVDRASDMMVAGMGNYYNAETESDDDDVIEGEESISDSSSTPSIDIDELVSRHLKGIPKIGMASCSDTHTQPHPPPLQFQRFDQRSRVPIHPSNRINYNRPHPLTQSFSRENFL